MIFFEENIEYIKIFLYAMTSFFTLLYIFQIIQRQKSQNNRLGIYNNKNMNLDFFYVSSLKRNISTYLEYKNKLKYKNLLLFISMVLPFLLFILIIKGNQYFIAIVSLVFVYSVIFQVFNMLVQNIEDKFDENLPIIIDSLIKSYSKEGDIKSVMLDVGRNAQEPFKTDFINMSRQMIINDPIKILENYANKKDNIWIHSLVFILTSYQDEAKKEDIILNLKELSIVVEKENQLRRANSNDKQYSLVMNYVLVGISIVGSIANILYNPVGKYFFFETLSGLIVFVLGYISIFITIMLNLNAKKRKKRR